MSHQPNPGGLLVPDPPADAVQGYILFAGPSTDASDRQVSAVEVTQSDFDPTAPAVELDNWNDLGLLLGDQVCFWVKAYNSAGTSNHAPNLPAPLCRAKTESRPAETVADTRPG